MAHDVGASQLFSFTMTPASQANETRLSGKQNAPSLEPRGGPGRVIDVVKDFQWTASQREKHIVKETPHINFKEYHVIGNAVIQQAKYMAKFGVNAVAANLGTIGGAMAGGAIGAMIPVAGGALVGAAAGAYLGSGSMDMSPKGYLEPYKDLYAVKPTGFAYRFPFFEENFRTTMTQWQGPTVSDSPIGEVYKSLKAGGANFASDAATVLNEPNTFIEESMQYEHPRVGSQFQFTFYLSNTHSYYDVVRNWHLAYLLLYQNLPNRTSAVLIRPPVIYEVNIPGIFYHPYCFINSLAVNHKGAQRKMIIDTANLAEGSHAFGRSPGADKARRHEPGKLETTVPDGYEIKIQVTPLVKETQNFMYHSATEASSSIYDVKVRD